jgi:hypothetical protein
VTSVYTVEAMVCQRLFVVYELLSHMQERSSDIKKNFSRFCLREQLKRVIDVTLIESNICQTDGLLCDLISSNEYLFIDLIFR